MGDREGALFGKIVSLNITAVQAAAVAIYLTRVMSRRFEAIKPPCGMPGMCNDITTLGPLLSHAITLLAIIHRIKFYIYS